MAEVHKLDGKKVEPAKAKGDPKIAELLAALTALNEDGRLTALIVATREDDGIGTYQRGTWRGGFFEAIGAIEVLKHDLATNSLVSRD